MMTENTKTEEITKPLQDILFVGERNAIIFSASAGEPIPPVDLTDDFFDLNKDDIRILYKQMKDNRERMEHLPFRTKAVREMEENAATLSRLNHYTHTVLRIQFPDRNVLQAVFNHSETVQNVMDFVQPFLEPSDVQFQLYTAPPKAVLRSELTLIEAKLMPRALLYFGATNHRDHTTYLRETLTSSLTNPHLASEAALQFRRKDVAESHPEDLPTVTEDMPSTSDQKFNARSSVKSSKSSTAVPKWFKR